jgi:hypothetical protein
MYCTILILWKDQKGEVGPEIENGEEDVETLATEELEEILKKKRINDIDTTNGINTELVNYKEDIFKQILTPFKFVIKTKNIF